jgi:hypothetical protein
VMDPTDKLAIFFTLNGILIGQSSQAEIGKTIF